MAYSVLLHLLRPNRGVSVVYKLDVTHDEVSGTLAGPELPHAAAFLRHNPAFDVEWEGKMLARCRLSGMATADALPFTHEGFSAIELVEDRTPIVK